jgi:2-methylcitrate dehydratase PrpD
MPDTGADHRRGARLSRGLAAELAEWAHGLNPRGEDLDLAGRALVDTVAVMLAARADPVARVTGSLSEPGRWAVLAHVLDFDDLHLPSTAHISAICVPAALASGGGARAYLAGAGVMARLGIALGWSHYAAGWHATCTAGAPAAAVVAAVAQGLDADRIATAMALAVPAAGGVQRAFGTQAKSLQVAFAVEAGLRAAALAAAGAEADPRALEEWAELVGGDPVGAPLVPEAVPGGLAIKLYPCCYALQRPIAALRALGPLNAAQVRRIEVSTPASALTPLIHRRPVTGLEGKFSLEYGLACALLDDPLGLESFGDAAVGRAEARRLMEAVSVRRQPDGHGLLAGEVAIALTLDGGEVLHSALELPPGAPGRAVSEGELAQKLRACLGSRSDEVRALDWASAGQYLRSALAPGGSHPGSTGGPGSAGAEPPPTASSR